MSGNAWRHGRRWRDRQAIAQVVDMPAERAPVGRKGQSKADGWNNRRRVWMCEPGRHWIELTGTPAEQPAPKQCPECHSADLLDFGGAGEAERFRWLWLLQDRGEIRELHHHPRYDLLARAPTGRLERVGIYIADAAYTRTEDGIHVVEDHKPKSEKAQDPLFRWKRRHFEIQYGQPITIVTS